MAELSQEKSLQLAQFIEMMKPSIHLITELIGTEYLEKLAVEFHNRASFQESALVLNPSHNPRKDELLRENAKCIKFLKEFIDSMKRCDELKAQIQSDGEVRDRINSMFL